MASWMSRAGLAMTTLVVVASSSSCTPPWKQAYLRGEAAVTRASYDDAALAFSESCEIDETASDACVRARSLSKRAVEDALNRSTRACPTDLGRCLDTLQNARRLAVRDQNLAAAVAKALDDASAAHIARCRAINSESYQGAMSAARCVAQYENDVGTKAHAGRVAAAMEALAASLDPTSASTGEPGYAALRAGLAQCYAPTSARAAVVGRHQQDIVARHTATIAVDVKDGLPPQVATVLCRADAVAKSPLRCGTGDRADVVVSAGLRTSRVSHTTAETPMNIRYVDHVEQRRNPDYAPAKQRAENLQDAVREAKRTADIEAANCDGADRALRDAKYCFDCGERTQRDTSCATKDIAERALRETKNAADDAERQWRDTPETNRIEHTALFDFISTRHTWTQNLVVDGRCDGRAFSIPPIAAQRSVRFEDDTHVGFARAGLAEDPLAEPSGNAFVTRGTDVAVAELTTFVAACVTAFGADSGHCTGEVDCLQRRALYRGQDPITETMSAFSRAVDDANPGFPKAPCRSFTP